MLKRQLVILSVLITLLGGLALVFIPQVQPARAGRCPAGKHEECDDPVCTPQGICSRDCRCVPDDSPITGSPDDGNGSEPPCEPISSCPASYECGSISDGCSGSVNCGDCTAPTTECSGNRCYCPTPNDSPKPLLTATVPNCAPPDQSIEVEFTWKPANATNVSFKNLWYVLEIDGSEANRVSAATACPGGAAECKTTHSLKKGSYGWSIKAVNQCTADSSRWTYSSTTNCDPDNNCSLYHWSHPTPPPNPSYSFRKTNPLTTLATSLFTSIASKLNHLTSRMSL